MPNQHGVRRPYHHGNLKQALLESAEQILREQGVQGLKLRAIAKRAGVSHTAADPHFGDLTGLLSELAAIGYERLHAAMSEKVGSEKPGSEKAGSGAAGEAQRAREIAEGYIGFARANPDLFTLMFRGDTLDMTRPRLQQAARNSYVALGAATASGSGSGSDSLSLADAGRQAAAWGLVHGLAMLLINGRLRPILSRIDPEPEPEALIEAALGSLSFT